MEMLLIIRDELINPPSEISVFRDVTLFATVLYNYDVIVESNDKDVYWNYLKQKFCHDYVKDVVRLGEERGVRLDRAHNYCGTNIVVPLIAANNYQEILKNVAYYAKLKKL